MLLIHRRNLMSLSTSFDRKLWQLKQKEGANSTLNHLWSTLTILKLMKVWVWRAAVMMMVLCPRYNWQLPSVVHGNVIWNVIVPRHQPQLEHPNQSGVVSSWGNFALMRCHKKKEKKRKIRLEKSSLKQQYYKMFNLIFRRWNTVLVGLNWGISYKKPLSVHLVVVQVNITRGCQVRESWNNSFWCL